MLVPLEEALTWRNGCSVAKRNPVDLKFQKEVNFVEGFTTDETKISVR